MVFGITGQARSNSSFCLNSTSSCCSVHNLLGGLIHFDVKDGKNSESITLRIDSIGLGEETDPIISSPQQFLVESKTYLNCFITHPQD